MSTTTIESGGLAGIERWLDEQFARMVAAADIPGAAVAVLAGDEALERAAGVLNLRTGVAATTDSVFQIGSITKVWTATLVMQLVDDGLLDLDAPVRTYLPNFRAASDEASAVITPRHLLTHTSGLEGDFFVEVGRGDDVIQRYCDEILPDVPQLFPPGTLFSYCNTGFIMLGRIVEVLRKQHYNDVLLERLAEPLGLRAVSPRADDAILHRAAVGHLRSDGKWLPARAWAAGYAGMPAGSMLAMTAADLLRFAQSHVDGSTTTLSGAASRAMRTAQVEVPSPDGLEARWGLGWAVEHWPGGLVIGHDGGTIGQSAYLRLAPEHGVAVALLTNGGRPDRLFRALAGPVFHELAGIDLPPRPDPPEHPESVDPHRYVGRYESRTRLIDIEADRNGELFQVFRLQNELADMLQRSAAERNQIVRLSGDTFMIIGRNSHDTFSFVGDDGSGRAAFLHSGGRASPRVQERHSHADREVRPSRTNSRRWCSADEQPS
ncbi:serine hydrolase domain-containing protein [Microlunatus speluncae]|uniref:serine hydrolase domain-containing protein n=1 Tax=Microlunatus speluncae TaxID=2594267 RepID=UPI0012666E66|nr:serine hydrolase domain-containing protein [Microlunatus speluncae]